MSVPTIIPRELIARLCDELRVVGSFTNSSAIATILNAIIRRTAQFEIPQTVFLDTRTHLHDLRYLRCASPHCGNLVDSKSNPMIASIGRCPNQDGPLIPAPVWILKYSGDYLTTQSGIPFTLSIETVHPGAHAVRIRDLSRPLASMVVDSRSQTQQIRPVYRSGRNEWFIALSPSESITKPFSITVFSCEEGIDLDLNPRLCGVDQLIYCTKLRVLQATLGYLLGHPMLTRRQRVFVIDGSEDMVRLKIRYIETKGLVVKVKRSDIEQALASAGLARTDSEIFKAMHTMAHAFLVRLPQIAGLDAQDFGEAVLSSKLEIAVFDNAWYGIGGIESVVDLQNRKLRPNYLVSILEASQCPLSCLSACRACLFTDSCFMLNWALDRRILLALGWTP